MAEGRPIHLTLAFSSLRLAFILFAYQSALLRSSADSSGSMTTGGSTSFAPSSFSLSRIFLVRLSGHGFGTASSANALGLAQLGDAAVVALGRLPVGADLELADHLGRRSSP